jgi:hypothetical protein
VSMRLWSRSLCRALGLAAMALLAGIPELGAQTPDQIPSELEAQIFNLIRRVTALEDELAKITGPAASRSGAPIHRIQAPFEVVDVTGKPILQVLGGEGLTNFQPGGIVIVEDPKTGLGALTVMNKAGEPVAILGTNGEAGGLGLGDPDGTIRTSLTGTGRIVISDSEKKNILVVAEDISKEDAAIRIGGDDNGFAVEVGEGGGEAILGIDEDGVAQLQLTDPQNQQRAYLDAEGTLMISDETGFDILRVADDVTGDAAGVAIGGGKGGGVVRVTDAAGKPAAGIIGSKRAIVVVNASGKVVSEMVVNETGGGFFQVWGGGAAPIAVLGRSPESEGGIIQVSNGKVPVASLFANEGGAGQWQLTDAAGTPVVEAGSMESGRGTVRVGPGFKCVPITMSLRVPDCIIGRTE